MKSVGRYTISDEVYASEEGIVQRVWRMAKEA